MKRLLITLVVALVAIQSLFAQLDTLYYNKEWKGVSSKIFANYYRVIETPTLASENASKPFRTFYKSGELQSEGYYIKMSPEDDTETIFDGDFTAYYKNGNIERTANYRNGLLDGEIIFYNENGLISEQAFFIDGLMDGIYTQFASDGTLSIQTEYLLGEPRYEYSIVTDIRGLSSKVRISDNKPFFDTVSPQDIHIEYKDGHQYKIYDANGLVLMASYKEVKDYGRYYQVQISLSNNSLFEIEFDPSYISANLTNQKGELTDLDVLSADEYIKKVKRAQDWEAALMGLAVGLSSMGAGTTTTTTTTYDNGSIYSNGSVSSYGNAGYGSGSYSDNTYYSETSTSYTTEYDATKAFQTQVLLNKQLASYSSSLERDRVSKNEGYLKRSTIYPGETIIGYINIKRGKRGTMLDISIPINSIHYKFSWDL